MKHNLRLHGGGSLLDQFEIAEIANGLAGEGVGCQRLVEIRRRVGRQCEAMHAGAQMLAID